jgi:hypothetical protein
MELYCQYFVGRNISLERNLVGNCLSIAYMVEVGFGTRDTEIFYATIDRLMPPIYGHEEVRETNILFYKIHSEEASSELFQGQTAI